MELAPQEKAGVYWKGAISAAIRGIPQGIMLGAVASVLLFGGIYALGAIGLTHAFAGHLAYAFGSFLFSNGMANAALPAFSLALFNPVPIIVFNTVLTAIGNFLTGGNAAVAEYHQQKRNAVYEAKIAELEGREQMVEQALSQEVPASRSVQQIINRGPRTVTRDSYTKETAPGTLSTDTITRVGPPTGVNFTGKEEARAAAANAPESPTIH